MLSKEQEQILEMLNDEQKKPVLDYHGPQFIVAGPGSGKTFTIVQRAKFMILDGIDPSNMLIFTFTNKAASEIKERIASAVGEDTASKITMGTYHSFCCRLLKRYTEQAGYKKGFSIFDAEDSKKIIGKLIKGTNVNKGMLMSYISGAKRKLISPQKALEMQGGQAGSLAEFYSMYQRELKQQNAMDFDDLIYNTIKMLEANPEILMKVNSKYRYISADESHDSSSADIRLIQLLSGTKERNVCFILDDNQSIYGFRGADIDAVLNIRNIFPDLKYFFLNRNYRCSGNIVGASKSLIKHNSKQIEKEIFTTNEQGDPIFVFEEKDPSSEALRVAKTIQLLNAKYGTPYKDIAILYRTSAQSRIIEEALLNKDIAYEILSGVNFFQRKEIKDLLSYLRIVTNPFDIEAFNRAVNIPKRGIGDRSKEKILEEAREFLPPIDCLTASKNLIENKTLKGKTKTGLQDFLRIVELVKEKKDSLEVSELIALIVKETSYYAYLENLEDKDKDSSDDYDARVENVLELIELSTQFESLDEFLEKTSLHSSTDNIDDECGKVQLLTMHMSKGLEWPNVFIIGSNEGTSPHFRSLESEKQLEEERRIYYVAMTRAKKRLFLSRAKKVQRNGFLCSAKRSRFINELDSKYLFQRG